MEKEVIRKPAVAGSFYPSNPHELSGMIHMFLESVPEIAFDGDLIGLISPHAGYVYSGQVAAYGYKLVNGMDFKRVVVIAPSHRIYFNGASVWSSGGFSTPLGTISIDEHFSKRLTEKSKTIDFVRQAHIHEHSLEVQLPFLQTVLEDFLLVPIVMGSQDIQTCKTVASEVVELLDEVRTLFIASSDLSHYYPYDQAVFMDKLVMEALVEFDPEKLAKKIDSGTCEACGSAPMITIIMIGKML
ncbi:MAG: AmmeMemoRadiSam system protein B, partial [Thermodesulfobacteriota bacterium]|nr:AmmeMemoRadiSam system protein B [Thermodesulfobacteriota bacterium]